MADESDIFKRLNRRLKAIEEGREYSTADEVLADMGEPPAAPRAPGLLGMRPPPVSSDLEPVEDPSAMGPPLQADRTIRPEGITITPRPMYGPEAPPALAPPPLLPGRQVPRSQPASGPAVEPSPAARPAPNDVADIAQAQAGDSRRRLLASISNSGGDIAAALTGTRRVGEVQPFRSEDELLRRISARKSNEELALRGKKADTDAINAQSVRLQAESQGVTAEQRLRLERERLERQRKLDEEKAARDAAAAGRRPKAPTPPGWDLLDHHPISGTSPTPKQVDTARKMSEAYAGFRSAVNAYAESVRGLSLADKLTPAAFNKAKAVAQSRYSDVETAARKANETGVPSAAELAGVARQVGNATSGNLNDILNAQAIIDDYAKRSFEGYRAKLRPYNVEPDDALAPVGGSASAPAPEAPPTDYVSEASRLLFGAPAAPKKPASRPKAEPKRALTPAEQAEADALFKELLR